MVPGSAGIARVSMAKLSIRDLDSARTAGVHPRGLQRPAEGRRDRRRHADRGVAADDQVRARARRDGLCSPAISDGPKGKPSPQLSLQADCRLDSRNSSARQVTFVDDCVGDGGEASGRAMPARKGGGRRAAREPVAFTPEEEKNDPAFAAALASLADLYVDDAFGAAHRAHASVEGITHHFARAAAGLLMEQELRYLGHALESPERPFVAILGGAKVSDKLEVIENLLGKVDRLLIGGAMAYTFFKSRGVPIGRSLVEDDKLEAAKQIAGRGRHTRRAPRAAGGSRGDRPRGSRRRS